MGKKYMKYDFFSIFIIALISALITILAIYIYHNHFNNDCRTEDQLRIINGYMRQLIVGFPL